MYTLAHEPGRWMHSDAKRMRVYEFIVEAVLPGPHEGRRHP